MARPSSNTRGCIHPPSLSPTDGDEPDGEESSVGLIGHLRTRRFVRRDGHGLPERLCARLNEGLVAAPYSLVTAWRRERLESASAEIGVDVDALALVLTGSLSAHRGIKTAFGAVPDDVDYDRVLAVWVDLCMAFAKEVGIAT